MPDGGMWDMSQLMLEQLKRCCGYKGHWACAHDYPDHMVPVSRFALSAPGAYGNRDGLQHHCKSCSDYRQAQRPKHPITGENKRHWKHRIAIKRGGDPKSPFWPYYLIKAEDQWDVEMKNYLLDKRPAQEYFDWVDLQNETKKSNIAPFFYPPEHEKRLKSAGSSVESAIKARNANKDDGFIYTLTHPLWREIKIGYTFNPPSRLSNFNTCCPHRLFSMPYISVYLKNANLAEDEVHEILKEHRADGEWFDVSIEVATKTIEDYVESLDDSKK